jgi:hypothetical protein
VCAIKDTSWIEQVFQFVVLNKLAKPISSSFLTGLLNTSLTNIEVRDIEDRLETIGVKNTDRTIVKYLNYEPNSPFEGFIAEAGEISGVDNTARLSDKGMIRLAKRWKQMGGPKKSLEIKMFIPAIAVKSLSEARSKWKSYETWMPYFFAFWQAMKDKYDKDGIWVKSNSSSLLYIVTMHAMQDLWIVTKSKADKRFANVAEFRKDIEEYFDQVPGTFFMNWQATGLQSGDGPDYIKKAILNLREGMRLAKLQDTSPLFNDSSADGSK